LKVPAKLKRLVLDVLKPRELDTIQLAKLICELDGVSRVDVAVVEVDVRTETLKLTVEGGSIDIEEVHKLLEDHGCALRSIDALSFEKS